MKTDTIAAIATGMSNSGIGIVRISGEEAFSVIDSISVSYTHLDVYKRQIEYIGSLIKLHM